MLRSTRLEKTLPVPGNFCRKARPMVTLRLRLIVGCIAMLAGALTVARSLYAQYPATSPQPQQQALTPAAYASGSPQPYPPQGPQGFASPEVYEAQDKGLLPNSPQGGPITPPGNHGGIPNSAAGAPIAGRPTGEVIVRGIRVEGNHTTDVNKLPKFSTRIGQPFDHRLVLEDVRSLNSDRRFLDAKAKYRELPDGIEVIFQVVERPSMLDVIFVGNQDFTNRKLLKKSELQKNAALDPYQVEEARRRLEQLYHEQGYPHASVQVIEGDDLKDSKAVMSVHEGTQEKIFWTSFEGNTVVGDGRLRTQIETTRTIMWVIGGKVDRKKIDEDVNRLTAYYRSLGYFDAKIGRVLEFGESKKWLTARFIINEGPRYSIRNVSFIGNEKFTNEVLKKDLALKHGEPFNQDSLNKDLGSIRDVYGGHGYIFADVQADPRLSDDKPEVDLVYNIEEGKRYRAGKIHVHIGGENPHTAHAVILNRMSVRPGDIVDTRKLRDDERRMRFSQIFEVDPAKGGGPKIVFNKPDDQDGALAERPSGGSGANSGSPPGYRGQSPDGEGLVDVRIIQNHSGEVEKVIVTPMTGPIDQSVEVLDSSGLPVGGEVRMQSPDTRGSNWGSAPNNYWNNYNANPSAQGAPAYGNNPSARTAALPPSRPTSSSPYLPPSAQTLPANTVTSPGALPTTPAYPALTAPAPSYTTPPAYASPVPAPAYNSAPTYTAPQPSYSAPAPAYTQPPAAAVAAPGGFDPYANPQPYVVQQQPGFGQPLVAPPLEPGASAPGGFPGGLPPLGPNNNITPIGVQPPIYTPPTGDPYVDLDIQAAERQTGRLMLGVGVNSDAGLVGNFVLDEQNFDITRLPRSWDDVRTGRAWRGAGQRFRIEANPGTVVQRYAVSFQEPYLFGSPVQLSLSGFYFTRIYRDWSEERVGGKVGLGYLLTQDLSVRGTFRGEEVTIFDPRDPAPPQLTEVVGNNTLLGFGLGMSHDTRDSPFLPTQGHLVSADFEQVTGSFNYPRAILEGRQYYLLRERADRSGRHTVSVGGVLGFSGDNTPIYDNFFAGGFSTLRGFAFRGASPVVDNVQVGGPFELLGTVEYMFPITADDALRGVISCDFGTVEQSVGIHWDQFRVAPGFGLRINVPAMGPAPLAFDFNFPVAFAETDQQQIFAFFVGLGR
jgi:outer membrane protein insertion porin family